MDEQEQSSCFIRQADDAVSCPMGYTLTRVRTHKDKIKLLKDAGYYHDIGKIVLSKNLIGKTNPLTPSEKVEMQQHPIVGFRLMNLFSNTLDLADSIYYHHERWDGSGYPKGLRSEEIPINSRIIAIAEQYDHLTNTLTEKIVSKERLCCEYNGWQV